MKEVSIIMKELRQQYEWRKEESGCGNCEVSEGWDTLKGKLIAEIKRINPSCQSEIIDTINNS